MECGTCNKQCDPFAQGKLLNDPENGEKHQTDQDSFEDHVHLFFSHKRTMSPFHIFLTFLKAIVIVQTAAAFLDVDLKHATFFLVVDTLFKVSLGLFLGFYFMFPKKEVLSFEDRAFVSVGGFLILREIRITDVVFTWQQFKNGMKLFTAEKA